MSYNPAFKDLYLIGGAPAGIRTPEVVFKHHFAERTINLADDDSID
jgi:hypothetical protein